jgi:Adenosine deaminase
MHSTASAVLALCFGDLDAIGSASLLRRGDERNLREFADWTLLDLVVERFPDLGRPALRFELDSILKGCDGDPVRLLRIASHRLEDCPPSLWRDRFPLDIFSEVGPRKSSIDFSIADAHLHSGASVPLSLFFSVLASAIAPIARADLENRLLRSRGGSCWDLHTLLIATRWGLRLLRCVGDDYQLDDYRALEERGLHHCLLDRVANGSYWQVVAELAGEKYEANHPLRKHFTRRFPYNGLCSVADVFWSAARRPESEFEGREKFLIGLVRACAAISTVVRARPGDGLSRFVDRFKAMGVTRDAAVGEMKSKLTRQALARIATTGRVVGAEFRKTIAVSGRDEFKAEARAALRDHHRGFADFVNENGNAMALTMPIGFARRPCSGRGGDWTDIRQLREAVAGFNALRLLLTERPSLALAISTIDVAGDEYGSANWPFAATAELLRRADIPLSYSIHAGESFYSPLNGIRRIGELFLADRCPDRIGHALALSEDAAKEVCKGDAPPPIRIGDAICDLAWVVLADIGNDIEARDLLYELVRGQGGQSYEPQYWIDAFRLLFSVDSLVEHRILADVGGVIEVSTDATLRECARLATPLGRVLSALAWGFDDPKDDALVDVKRLVPDALNSKLHEFSVATAPAARNCVLDLLTGNEKAGRGPTLIEACPTSNIRLANLKGYDAHPIWAWKQEGIGVVVGSDDPLIFGATITDEFQEMLAVRDVDLVREIAAETVACCSGGRRRDLVEFEAVAAMPV